MIDIQVEKLIPLDEAARLIPGRDGGHVHPGTVSLWTRRGRLGVVLESTHAGPRRCTSVQAVGRFLERLSAAAARGKPVRMAIGQERTARQKAAAVRQAVAELEGAGA